MSAPSDAKSRQRVENRWNMVKSDSVTAEWFNAESAGMGHLDPEELWRRA